MGSSFFSKLLVEANLQEKDIYQIFYEYENERILVPPLSFHKWQYKIYSAQMWTIDVLKGIVLDAFHRNADIVWNIEQFAHYMDHCATQCPVGEMNQLFSTCHDTACDILSYFLV